MTSSTLPPSALLRRRAGATDGTSRRSLDVRLLDPSDESRRLHRAVRLTGVAAAALLLSASAVAPGAVATAAVPIALVGALLGIPHGAVDHVVPGWLAGRALRTPVLAGVLAAYVGVVAAGAAALRFAPTATLLVFLAVAAWHFGRGEVAAAAEAAQRPVPRVTEDLLPVLAHGLVTVLLPLAARPDVAGPFLTTLAPGLPTPPGWARPAALTAIIAVVALAAIRLGRLGRRGEAGELLLLTALFGLVHPFAAFGVYFGLWHALRHTARLVDLAAAGAPLRTGARRFVTQAALPTAGALAVLGGVGATLRLAGSTSGGGAVLAAELATLAALTFPHAAVVTGLDEALRRRSGPPAGTSRRSLPH